MAPKNYDDIKRRIRKLKQLELKLRFPDIQKQINTAGSYSIPKDITLVWDEFFDLHEIPAKNVKYPIKKLALMNKDELKDIMAEYFYQVYYRIYKEHGLISASSPDPDTLTQLGLPYHADLIEIKKKFRELAKLYHPDAGGDSSKFIELIENYHKHLNHQ